MSGGKSEIKIVCALDMTLGIDYEGNVFCFGNEKNLLNLENVITPLARRVDGLTNIVSISCYASLAICVASDGKVWYFGTNDVEGLQLCESASQYCYIPTQITGMHLVSNAYCGKSHYLFLDYNVRLWGCGTNTHGELALVDPSGIVQTPALVPLPEDVIPLTVSCGEHFTIMISQEGNAYGTGSNVDYRLGMGTLYKGSLFRKENYEQRGFKKVLNISGAKSVTCGEAHTLVLTEEGIVYSFGKNSQGQLGHGDKIRRYKPRSVQPLPTIEKIFCSPTASICLGTNGSLWVFGIGPTGHNSRTKVNFPVLLRGLNDITAVDSGANHSVFFSDSGSFYICGNNSNNRFGFPTEYPIIISPIEIPADECTIGLSMKKKPQKSARK